MSAADMDKQAWANFWAGVAHVPHGLTSKLMSSCDSPVVFITTQEFTEWYWNQQAIPDAKASTPSRYISQLFVG